MDIDQLMRAVAIVLAVTAVAVSIAKRLNLGSTLGLLVVGAALGPHSPHPLLGISHVDELQAVGEIGIVLLLFLLGLDIRPARLWAMRGMIVGLGTAQYILSSLAIAGVLLLTGVGAREPVLVIGLALAMSSAAVAMAALEEHGDTNSPQGRATIAVQILQSFVLIGLLTVIPLLGSTPRSIQPPGLRHTSEVLGVILGIQLLARFVLPRLLTLTATNLGSGAFGLTIIAAVFGAAATLDSFGVSMALGGFMLGVNLSRSIYVDQLKVAVDPAKRLLLGLFFITVGMALDWREVLAAGPGPLLLLLVLLAVKFGVVTALGLAFRIGRRAAVLTAALLMPLDEVGYVVLGSASATGLLGPRAYALGLTFISVSFVVSPLLITLAYRLTARMRAAELAPAKMPSMAGRVVVAGYGPGGRGVCLMLEAAQVPFLAVDHDLDRLRFAGRFGHDVRYGDLTDPNLLTTVDVDRARAVIVTMPEFPSARRLVDALKRFHPRVPTLVAVSTLGQQDSMRQLGVEHVVTISVEGTLRFSRLVLTTLGVEEKTTESILGAMEANDYAAMRTAEQSAAPVRAAAQGSASSG
ncbi:MAG TPA: cation:proton antiporter [Myxococcaceae bacterium]|nr:cation:proton antiporter [Myxococcaceae bacterium]